MTASTHHATKSTKHTAKHTTAAAHGSPEAAAETTAPASPEVSASTPATSAPAAAVAPTPAPSDVASAATKVMSLLQELSALIPFDDPTAQELQAARGSTRVPDEALSIAASILAANGPRFPDLDLATIKAALAYDQSLGPVALELEQLQQRTAKTVTNRRAKGVTQTLVLYQMLKGLSRVSLNQATLVQQKQLAKLLKTSHKVRATSVTEAELQTAKQGMKATKKANVKAADAASANAEAQQAAAMQAAVLGTANGASGSGAAPAATTPAPTAAVAPASEAAPAAAAPTTGH